MAIALPVVPHLFTTSLQALFGWLAGERNVRAARAPVVVARSSVHGAAAMPVQQPAKPLRVVRVVEPSAPRAVAGRMRISGRLADVCAELDRMAAQEARGC